MPKLQTLEVWTDAVNEEDDFDLLLLNLIDAAVNIRNLQVNSCLTRNIVPVTGPDSRMQNVERLSLIGSPFCKLNRQRVLNDNSNGVNRFIGSLPKLHTLVLYFKQVDVCIYRIYYSRKGLNIVSGEKLMGQDTTKFLFL